MFSFYVNRQSLEKVVDLIPNHPLLRRSQTNLNLSKLASINIARRHLLSTIRFIYMFGVPRRTFTQPHPGQPRQQTPHIASTIRNTPHPAAGSVRVARANQYIGTSAQRTPETDAKYHI